MFEDLAHHASPGIDISLVQQLGLNFYAGHNLRTPTGHNIGALCLDNPSPRSFSTADLIAGVDEFIQAALRHV